MPKQIIAVDIDDTLTASNEGVRLYINRTFGTNHSSDDYQIAGEYHRYWDRVWGVDEATAIEWYRTYINSDETFHLLPIPGAIDAMRKLEQSYNLIIVSSRDVEQIEHTKRWLDKNVPDVFRQIEFIKLHPKGKDTPKAVLLKELDVRYLIDDNLDHCVPAQQAGIQTLLFGDYGWSKERDIPQGIVRAKDWSAVLEYFDGQTTK